MRSASTSYNGVAMECAYTYSPAEPQTWIEPGSPEDCTLESCKVGGVEIIDLLTPEQIVTIEWKLLEQKGDEDHNEAAEAYHRQRDERAAEGFLA